MTISIKYPVEKILCRTLHNFGVSPIMGATFTGQNYADMLWSNSPEQKVRSG